MKIIIIGGGVSGLSAGIYARLNGFDAVIYEQCGNLGGLCSGWDRGGFHIDGCITSLYGTKRGMSANRLWNELGALSDYVTVIRRDKLANAVLDGKRAAIYSDFKKTEAKLLEAAPEDKKAIHKLLTLAKIAGKLDMPCDRLPEKPLPAVLSLKLFPGNLRALPLLRYTRLSAEKLYEPFTSPLIKRLLHTVCAGTSGIGCSGSAFDLLFRIGTFCSGAAANPKGGSVAMIKRMERRFVSLGGKVNTNTEVMAVTSENGRATGVSLGKGQTDDADYVIITAPPEAAMELLPEGCRYEHGERARNDGTFRSCFKAAFGADLPCLGIEGAELIDCLPLDIGEHSVSELLVTNYNFDDFAPHGKTVLQVTVPQDSDDYRRWQELDESGDVYITMKQNIAEEILQRLEEHYRFLKGKLKILDIVTPYSYNKRCKTHLGAYMGMTRRLNAPLLFSNGKISGMSGVLLAGQRLSPVGGLTAAAAQGRFVIRRICRTQGKGFTHNK